MRLRKTNLDDLPQLKALWALGFGDTEQEIEAFFAISYPAATGFCAEEDGRLIAAAYALPQELAWGERTAKAAYLYAVTTHPDFRRQGICRKLLADDRMVIIENLTNLEQVGDGVVFFCALPLKQADADGAPIRAAVFWAD